MKRLVLALLMGVLIVQVHSSVLESKGLLMSSGVIITEVAFKASSDWAEVYNAGSTSVDISGYMLTDLDGTDTVFASSTTTLDASEYAVIHWSTGTDETDTVGDNYPANGYIDLYVSDTDLTGTDDQLVLVNDSSQFVDAVIWSNNDTTLSEGEDGDFNDLAPTQWNYSDVTNVTEYNVSRDSAVFSWLGASQPLYLEVQSLSTTTYCA